MIKGLKWCRGVVAEAVCHVVLGFAVVVVVYGLCLLLLSFDVVRS
jgi:hypothetical protein